MAENDDATSAEHLDGAIFERLMLGELSAFARAAALRHVEHCDECSRIHAALLAVEEGARAFDPGVPSLGQARPGMHRAAWLGLAAAATLALAVALPWRSWLAGPTPAAEDVLRSAGGSVAPTLAAPQGRAPGRPDFVWSSVPGALAYHVELFDAEAEPLWTSPPVHATSLPWPDAVPAAPGPYYWRVVASVGGGAESLASPLGRFELKDSAADATAD
jgi:hypothetical protein